VRKSKAVVKGMEPRSDELHERMEVFERCLRQDDVKSALEQLHCVEEFASFAYGPFNTHVREAQAKLALIYHKLGDLPRALHYQRLAH
jgi:hypothetical protein